MANGILGPASRAFARIRAALASVSALLTLALVLAAPVLAQ